MVVIYRVNLGVTMAMVGLHRIGAKYHLPIVETVPERGAGQAEDYFKNIEMFYTLLQVNLEFCCLNSNFMFTLLISLANVFCC